MTGVEYTSYRYHCVVSVQIRRFFRFVFFRIWTENGDLLRSFFFVVRILLYSNQKNLIKRNVVFDYILMYGDALPIVGNKFSKILIFLLINFRILSKRSLIQICFLLFCIFEPLRSKRFIVSLLSVAPLSCFWCFFFLHGVSWS